MELSTSRVYPEVSIKILNILFLEQVGDAFSHYYSSISAVSSLHPLLPRKNYFFSLGKYLFVSRTHFLSVML